MTNEERPAGGRWLSGRWLAIGSAVWAVALVAAGIFSVRRDPPTVREQRTVSEAAPIGDEAVVEFLAAGQGPDVALEISERRLDGGCRLSAGWDGVTLERSVIVRTVPAAAPDVLERVAERLPEGYRAGVRHGGDGTPVRLRADAGGFVALAGTVTSPGVVTLTARTGCRPRSVGFASRDHLPGTGVDPGARNPAAPLLAGMGVEAIERHGVTTVPCPGDPNASASTARASGRATFGPARRAALTETHGGTVVIDTAMEFAVSRGTTTVAARVDGDRIELVYTRTCAAGQ